MVRAFRAIVGQFRAANDGPKHECRLGWLHRSILLQCRLEAMVCLLHVEFELACLLVIQLLGGPHLVQSDEPLHDLALAFELLVSDLVDCLDDLHEQRM
jgi:hypothetical protein